jgi:hypothetical protein
MEKKMEMERKGKRRETPGFSSPRLFEETTCKKSIHRASGRSCPNFPYSLCTAKYTLYVCETHHTIEANSNSALVGLSIVVFLYLFVFLFLLFFLRVCPSVNRRAAAWQRDMHRRPRQPPDSGPASGLQAGASPVGHTTQDTCASARSPVLPP